MTQLKPGLWTAAPPGGGVFAEKPLEKTRKEHSSQQNFQMRMNVFISGQ